MLEGNVLENLVSAWLVKEIGLQKFTKLVYLWS